MMYALSVVLLAPYLVMSQPAEHIIDCSTYTCPVGHKYDVDGVEYTVTECSGANFWSKSMGMLWIQDGDYLDIADLTTWCKVKGYDGVGRMFKAADQDDDTLKNYSDEANFCTAKFADKISTNVYTANFYYATFECINYPAEPVESPCCTNWDGADCFLYRHEANNFHACRSCSPGNGPCEDACGGDAETDQWNPAMDSDACRDCCVGANHKISWNCPAPLTPEEEARALCESEDAQVSKKACKDILDSSVGKCKYKEKKSKCVFKEYYGGCAGRTGRACRKAVKKGVCGSDDGMKTCRDL